MSEDTYWVFARREPGAPLAQVGVLRAESVALARLYARLNYTERVWVDLCVVPKAPFSFIEGAEEASEGTR